jgi:VanZ family protein
MVIRNLSIKNLFIHYWKSILWLMLICYLLFLPGNRLPKEKIFQIPHIDKLIHAALFMILEFLLLLDTKIEISCIQLKLFLLINLSILFFGGITEVIQYLFIPQRTGSMVDLLADLSGMAVGVFLYGIYLRLINRFSHLKS